MGQFKGTEGKWTSFKSKNSNGFVYVNNEYLTAGSIATCYGIGEEPIANALLISKAPEILEMLEEISIRDEGSDEWLERVRNLIKSATEL